MLKIDVSFEINGKPMNPDNLSDFLKRLTFTETRKRIVEKLGKEKCAVHNSYPVVVIRGDFDNFSADLSGCCCTDFGNAMKEKLKQGIFT